VPPGVPGDGIVDVRGTHCCATHAALDAQQMPPHGGWPVTGHRPVACDAVAAALAAAALDSAQPPPRPPDAHA
jgi:hypothetical protein